jgi:hypothetical protein
MKGLQRIKEEWDKRQCGCDLAHESSEREEMPTGSLDALCAGVEHASVCRMGGQKRESKKSLKDITERQTRRDKQDAGAGGSKNSPRL